MSYTEMFEAAGKFVKLMNFLTMLAEQNEEFTNVGGDKKFTSIDKFRSEFATMLNQSVGERAALQILSTLNGIRDYILSVRNEVLANFESYIASSWAPEFSLNSDKASGSIQASALEPPHDVTINPTGTSIFS